MTCRWALLSLVLLGAIGHAREWHEYDNASTELTSLNYYPHSGVVEITPHVTTALISRTSNSNGTISKNANNQFFAGVNYGLFPGLRIHADETVLWDQITDALSTTGTETITTAAGASNPTLNMTWRFLEAAKTHWSGDLQVSASPSFGPKVTGDGSVGRTGNNLTGGWVAGTTLSFFWRWNWNQIEGAMNVQRIFESSIEGTTAAASSVSSPFWQKTWTLTDRLHLGSRHFLQVAAAYASANSHRSTNFNSIGSLSHSPDYINPSLAFGYSPQRTFLIELEGSWHQASTSSLSDKATSALTSELTTLYMTVALLHEF